MRTLTLIIVCSVLFAGCASERVVTRQQVIDALAKVWGKEEAEKSYAAWMEFVRPNCPDDATAHRKILDTIKMGAAMKKDSDATKDRLLHKTDHQAVLAAAREVIRNRHEFKRGPGWHGP